jgi:flagellar biosynthesis component FlhA
MMLALLISFSSGILAQRNVKLEDVFKHTQESMADEPGAERLIALMLGGVAVIVLLIVLQARRKPESLPKPVNNQNRLLKEMMKTLPLKDAEMKQLKQLADEQQCSSPLVLLMCPSLMAKALASKSPEARRAMAPTIKKLTSGNE